MRSIFVFWIVLKYFMLLFMIEQAVAFGFSMLDNPNSHFAARAVIVFDNAVLGIIRGLIPTSIKGFDFARILIFATAYISYIYTGKLSHLFNSISKDINFKDKYQKWKIEKIQAREAANASESDKEEKKLENDKSGKGKKDRVELLKLLDEVKQDLNSMKANLAFLSIDVVNSTGMKEGEEQTSLELDFVAYRNLVEKVFKENNYLKASWTPDGVMSCFKTPDFAVKAAMQIINELKIFNKNVKTISKDFTMRCGINSGKVAYDNNIPVDAMVDRVIDIAGHLQKYCPPGFIYISRNVYDEIFIRNNFKSAERVIDGIDVYVSL